MNYQRFYIYLNSLLRKSIAKYLEIINLKDKNEIILVIRN